MRKFILLALQLTLLNCTAVHSQTTDPNVINHLDASVDASKVIQKFAANELANDSALKHYAFSRDLTIETIGLGGHVTGKYNRNSNFLFDNKGNRYELILFFPAPTIEESEITPEKIQLFSNGSFYNGSKIGDYTFTYAGKQAIDELTTYIFDVTPKILSDSVQRNISKTSKASINYFQGRIWIDDRDYQVVKTKGKFISNFELNLPVLETYRENIDGTCWFPTYIYSDGNTGSLSNETHLKISVRYTNYKHIN